LLSGELRAEWDPSQRDNCKEICYFAARSAKSQFHCVTFGNYFAWFFGRYFVPSAYAVPPLDRRSAHRLWGWTGAPKPFSSKQPRRNLPDKKKRTN